MLQNYVSQWAKNRKKFSMAKLYSYAKKINIFWNFYDMLFKFLPQQTLILAFQVLQKRNIIIS